tara:strand:+ start:626 stop:1477 length:852 start_codon:yes stop_codon:yes gene_type:complete
MISVSDVSDISDTDLEEALEIIRHKKRMEEMAKSEFREEQEKALKFTRWLGLPDFTKVTLVTFIQKNTLIHISRNAINHDENHHWYNGYWSSEWRYIERKSRSLQGCWEAENANEEHARIDVSDFGWDSDGVVGEALFLNTITCCPFCGDYSVSEFDDGAFSALNFNFLRFPLPSVKPRSEWFSYKRCWRHEDTTRKEYIKGESELFDRLSFRNPQWGTPKENAARRLLNAIYPEPAKFSKKYYAEKRVKKVSKKRLLTKSENIFFTMLLGASKLTSLTTKTK